jgi:hypothetical protein
MRMPTVALAAFALAAVSVSCSHPGPRVAHTTQGVWDSTGGAESQLRSYLLGKAKADRRNRACDRLDAAAGVAADEVGKLPSIHADAVAAWQRAADTCRLTPQRAYCLLLSVDRHYNPFEIGPPMTNPIPRWPTCDPRL